MLLATGKQSADADKRVCDKNNSLSKASSQEYPKYQYPFLLDIVFVQSAFYCPSSQKGLLKTIRAIEKGSLILFDGIKSVLFC